MEGKKMEVEGYYEQIPFLHSLLPRIRWKPFSFSFVVSMNPLTVLVAA